MPKPAPASAPIALAIQPERAMPVTRRHLEEGLAVTWAAAAPGTVRVPGQPRILTVRVTDDREMRILNRTFRGMDEVTDVLSFGEAPDHPGDDLVVPSDLPGVLGDLVLSGPYIERVAARNATGAADEFMLCFVHGLLHLLGFDHAAAAEAKRMFQLQDRLVRDLGFAPRPTWPPERDRPDA